MPLKHTYKNHLTDFKNSFVSLKTKYTLYACTNFSKPFIGVEKKLSHLLAAILNTCVYRCLKLR